MFIKVKNADTYLLKKLNCYKKQNLKNQNTSLLKNLIIMRNKKT